MIYQDYPDNSLSVLQQSLKNGLQARSGTGPIPIYFRADDIGVISQSFKDLLELFSRYQTPLCLAVVPAWLTSRRWAAMTTICDVSSALWCWHQHGWRHQNYQLSGKKCEFGSDRSVEAISTDILKGRSRLQTIMGPSFSPFFTPPWNRCSEQTLIQLHKTGFKAVSRDRIVGLYPSSPIIDLPVTVDLHTRRERDGISCLLAMACDLESAVKNGTVGLMIHHQRMNSNSFALLEGLLELITRTSSFHPVHFGALV